MRLSILAKIIDLFFPHYCPICGNRLAGEEESICLSCNLHLPRTDTWKNPYDNEMAKMFWHLIPIEKACALFYYKGHSFASNILYQLKYKHQPDIAYDMGRLLAQEGMRIHFFDDIDGIIPIPITPKRRRERGYNQSEEIAKGVADITHIPIRTDIVKRIVFKQSQTHLNRWGRLDSVKNVFQLTERFAPSEGNSNKKGDPLAGKHFLIIDDVCTTGATIRSCCQAIMLAGNMKFSVLSIGYAKE